MDNGIPVLGQAELAAEGLRRRQEEERELGKMYARVFGTKEGQAVLRDLCEHFPHTRPRFDAVATKGNAVAALIGGIHFDGSAAVVRYVMERMESAKGKMEEAPVVVGA
ncbi:hypothetical protein DES53_115142 [Roseimicrobium gellanilyticum]|uniref:Bbp19-like phage domain-containing protein n=2 Tax=Roseimicrobium gellanilyticum TaxID=748857 RepID=A0A366H6B7_9BACT|nr:hypothetical protein DES53_115142 [Roseimicrobium gellanilyticum]